MVLLDLGLPDGQGLDFIQQFRTWSDKPIIVLSARHEESVKIMALDRGADDYLTKPFGGGWAAGTSESRLTAPAT